MWLEFHHRWKCLVQMCLFQSCSKTLSKGSAQTHLMIELWTAAMTADVKELSCLLQMM
jgi:hypothetical protein